jgi:hypothetical protein
MIGHMDVVDAVRWGGPSPCPDCDLEQVKSDRDLARKKLFAHRDAARTADATSLKLHHRMEDFYTRREKELNEKIRHIIES